MINVGVIGVGNMGHNHARIYARLPNARLCGVADADERRAQQAAQRFGGRAYRDYRELLAHEQLDAVTIAVPTRDHFSVASYVVERGVNLLVEKPLAGTVTEAEQLVEAAQRAGVHLAVGHIERFNPAVREIKRRVDAGALGKVSSVIAKRVGVMPPQVKDANVIIDLAVHDLDILNYLFGRLPDSVTAAAGNALLANRYDHAEIFLRYGTAGCFVQVNWITPLKIRTLSVTGDGGHAELNYVTQKLEIYETNAARGYDDFGDFVVRFGESERTVVLLQVVEPLEAELASFLQSVANNTPVEVSGADGVNALWVAARALEALE